MLNPRVLALNKSTTLKITALTKKLKKEGKDVINFAAGEPDFDTPDFIKDAAHKALDQGFTKYTPSTGIPELKIAIANKLVDENNIPCKPEDIIVTVGAKYALFSALLGVVREGDEVILPAPYWVSYPEMISLVGAKQVILETKEEDNFKIDSKKLAKLINSRTKLLILNYPSNPTGITYTKDELEAILNIVKDTNIIVLSDEIYEKLLYDGIKHTSFASLSGGYQRTITVNGFSKAFSMTGWRIGYLAGSNELIEQISKVIDHTTSCACSFSQYGALAALSDTRWQEHVRSEFEKRRNALWQGLISNCGQLKPFKPQGSFYLFCDIRQTGFSSQDFATKLLEQQLVSCIPAESFGAEGFVRFSFATSIEQINKGVERIKKFLAVSSKL